MHAYNNNIKPKTITGLKTIKVLAIFCSITIYTGTYGYIAH
jgi:hypothetical protein